MHADLTRDTSSVVWTLFGVVGLLLMIGCVNVASLMLPRAAVATWRSHRSHARRNGFLND